jgi:L-lactate dehydrogenase (cytochrome)
MIISASTDYRAAAQRRLPPFLFHYIDGGAYAEHTLRRNVADLSDIALRQRVLRNMSELSLETKRNPEHAGRIGPSRSHRHVRPPW